MSQRRIARRTLDHAGDGGGFRQRKILQFFSKEDARGLIDTTHSYYATLPQINFVAIERKDIFFGKPALEGERQHCLGVFSPQRALGCQVGVLDELLGDG